MGRHELIFKPLIETENYYIGDHVRYDDLFLEIIKDCTGKELMDQRNWGYLCLATYSPGDPGEPGEPGVIDNSGLATEDIVLDEVGSMHGKSFEFAPIMFDEITLGTIDIK